MGKMRSDVRGRRPFRSAPRSSRTSGSSDMITIVKDLAAEALFVSDLQPSQCPTREAVERAVTTMILQLGSDGCAAGVAVEFGDHPDIAVRRMCWVHSERAGVLAHREAAALN